MPDLWKVSIVVPLPKKSPHNVPENFRPVSVTCFPSRIFEKLIAKSITQFCVINDIVPVQQHGFMKHRSRETALLTSLNDWTQAIDAKLNVDVIYFDFSKAFDRVSHPKLIYKMKRLGFPANIVNWIENWLHNRIFFVRCSHSLSDPLAVTSGVPQGSVLGPILFNIFTSDLCMMLSNSGVSYLLYADDIKLYCSMEPFASRQLVQNAINLVQDWSHQWQLPLAVQKCQSFYLGRSNPKTDYFCNDELLPKVTSVVDLGFILTENLEFTDHITRSCKNARKRSFALLKAMKTNNKKVLLLAYKVYVRSILESGSVVYNPRKKKDIVALEKVQHYFTKKIFMRAFSMKHDATPSKMDRLASLGLPTLESRRYKADMKMMRKILNGSVVIPLNSMYTFRKSRTRGKTNKMVIPKCRMKVREHTFAVRTARFFNN